MKLITEVKVRNDYKENLIDSLNYKEIVVKEKVWVTIPMWVNHVFSIYLIE